MKLFFISLGLGASLTLPTTSLAKASKTAKNLTSNTAVEYAYSSIAVQNCVTVDSDQLEANPEIDHYTGECPSFGGYRLTLTGGDLIYSLLVRYDDKEVDITPLPLFHSVSSNQVEWRYQRMGSVGHRSVEFQSLIYQISHRGKAGYNSNLLVVIRLNKTKSCLLGTVPAQDQMLTKARALADNAKAICP